MGEGCSGARRPLAASGDLDERVDCRPRNAERQRSHRVVEQRLTGSR
jgi:hypothetical protein